MTPVGLPKSARARLYQQFRYSAAYPWYARLFRPGHARALAADRAFFRPLFADYGIRSVFDIGANVGDKADVFRRLADRVLCVEADPDTAAGLTQRFRGRRGVTVEAVAVGDRVGHADLLRKPFSGFNTLSAKWSEALDGRDLATREVVRVPVTTLERLIETHGRPDYVKIDVEGYELPVVAGLASAVPVLSFECNLPAFRTETDAIVARLLALDSGTRFNARRGDAAKWELPAPADANDLGRFLDACGDGTFDLFALRGGRA